MREGRPIKAHWVTWTDFIKNGRFIETWDDATWIVDGRRIGNGAALCKEILQWRKERRPLIVVLVPMRWEGNLTPFLMPGEAYDQLLGLADAKRFEVLRFRPMEKDE